MTFGRINKEKIIEDFRAMIRIPTVSVPDPGKLDEEAYLAFRSLLLGRFPSLYRASDVYSVAPTGILYHIRGESAKAPSVLMAHYDVVSADPKEWIHPPFAAEMADGRIYGRGTLDTKSTLWAIAEAADNALASGWRPKNDLYLSFGGEEETHGETTANIVKYLKSQGVRPAFVLDEGGAVIPEGVPGFHKKVAMVGIAEKGTANYMLSIEGKGGHASTPPKKTLAARMAKAAVRISEYAFPARITPPVRKMFEELSDQASFPVRPLFANVSRFAPLVSTAASLAGGSSRAMVRTTAAVVILEANSAFNVLPSQAAMGVNLRLLPGETLESGAEHLRKAVRDKEIRVDLIDGTNPTTVSRIDCPQWEMLRKVTARVWPDAAFAPYQLNGGTDSRFFHEISKNVYKFSPMEMTAAERATVHGANESILVENLYTTVVFYSRLLEEL